MQSINPAAAGVPLSRLIQGIPAQAGLIDVSGSNTGQIPVYGIALDSRQVHVGWLFVALIGDRTDGHKFIPDALQRGAAAVVGVQPYSGLPVPYIQVRDSRLALAYLSAAFYGWPAHHLTVIGVTGTDGKTTTASLIYHILQAAGLRAGMISTVNAVIGDQAVDTGFHVTTPESPDVQRYLAQMAAGGLTHVVLEATSHGLAQERVAACAFDLGVMTNITHEHLDYHGSFEAYREAKARLFTGLADTPQKDFLPPRGAVLNRDDESYEYLAARSKVYQVSYGLSRDADVRAEQIYFRPDGLDFILAAPELAGRASRLPITCRLVGLHNVSNCLAAAASTWGVLGLDGAAVQQGIAALPGVPGRWERIDLGQEFTAIVDFAHTPNALRRVLESARRVAGTGRVIAVFGSAGLRDREKRRLMAETSAALANLTLLTAEDPRTEPLDAILAEMAAGAEAGGGVEGRTFWRIPDRGQAIRCAVAAARPGDVVIACGKGHEQSMCFGQTEYAWDDRTAMRSALAEYLGSAGPEMPLLPTSILNSSDKDASIGNGSPRQ